MAYDPQAAGIIVPWARENGFDPALGVCTSEGEAPGLNVNERGDGGLSFGGLQIYTGPDLGAAQAERLPGDKWLGYDGLRRSLDFMLPRWRWALSQRPDAADAWNADPIAFFKGERGWWYLAQGAALAAIERNAEGAVKRGLAIYDDWVARFEGCWRDRATGLLCPMEGGVGRRYGVVDENAPNGHVGIDFGMGNGVEGAPIRAVRAGIVRYAGWFDRFGQPNQRPNGDPNGGLGLMVAIEDARGVLWRYGHNSRLYAYVGQRMRQGETIAGAGTTGYSFGVHSHLERLVQGVYTDPAVDLLDVVTPPPPPVPPPPPPPPEPPPRELTDAELLALLTARLAACTARGDQLQGERDQLQVMVENHAQRERSLEDLLTVEAQAKREMAALFTDQRDRLLVQAGNAERVVKEGA